MKIIGITASHKGKSNTKILVERVLASMKTDGFQTELIDLSSKNLEFCKDCGYCKQNPDCMLKDDVKEILSSMESADAIVVGTPTYFGGISGRLRVLFDRTLPLRRHGMKLSGKIGAALAVGGSRNGGQEFTISDIHRWMLIHEMTVVGDASTAHFGGIATARGPEEVLDDDVGLTTVDNLAVRLKKILK